MYTYSLTEVRLEDMYTYAYVSLHTSVVVRMRMAPEAPGLALHYSSSAMPVCFLP